MRMRAKIIDAIVKALRSHPDNADVRHSGLHALRSMCHTEEEFEHLKAEASGELNEESEHGEDTAAAAAASAMAALAEMQAALGGALSGRESTEEDEHEMTHSVRRISVILENHAARRQASGTGAQRAARESARVRWRDADPDRAPDRAVALPIALATSSRG